MTQPQPVTVVRQGVYVGEGCPLFTARHGHHSAVWTVPGFSMPRLCLACAMERLESPSELVVHTRMVLAEFRALLGAGEGGRVFLQTVSTDRQVLEHLCGLLFGLLVSRDATVAQSAMEVLITLLGTLTSLELPWKLLQKSVQSVMTSQNFPSSLPHLSLLGRLLHSMPSLCGNLVFSYGGFLEFLVGGMGYPDEMVKSSVVYVLVQLCSRAPHGVSLPLPLIQSVCRHISTNLASGRSHDLTINLLGLIKSLLKNEVYVQCLLQADRSNSEAKGSTLASALKRVLLSSDEMVQLSGVQSIAEVLAHCAGYGEVLLQADIAEFMFEALSSKNELLMSALFSCLNSLATLESFYSHCHVIYGLEPVILGLASVLRTRNFNAAQLGFKLMSKILIRVPASVQLFASPGGLDRLLGVLSTALQCPPVMLPAIGTFGHLLRPHHVPPGFTLTTFLPFLALLLNHIEPLTAPQEALLGPPAQGLQVLGFHAHQPSQGLPVEQGVHTQQQAQGPRAHQGSHMQQQAEGPHAHQGSKTQQQAQGLYVQQGPHSQQGAPAHQGLQQQGPHVQQGPPAHQGLQQHSQAPAMPAVKKRLLTEVFTVMERMCQLCSLSVEAAQSGARGPVVQPSDLTFLARAFEESLLPAILVNMNYLDQLEPFRSMFNIANSIFVFLGDLAHPFAKKLAFSGFIQLSLDVKSRFTGSSGALALSKSVNSFLEVLCCHLDSNTQLASYTKEVLHTALPHLNCPPSEALQFLSHRTPASGRPVATQLSTAGTTSMLQSLQRAVMAVFYYAHTHRDSLVPSSSLLQTLSSFLSLNPDVHLLPQGMFTHLVVLFAAACEECQTRPPLQPLHHGASQILVRGLLRVGSPESLFVPNSALLKWALKEASLLGLARVWLLQWVNMIKKEASGTQVQSTQELLEVLYTPGCLDSLMRGDALMAGGTELESTLEVMKLLLQGREAVSGSPVSIPTAIFLSLQKSLLVQRAEPLSGATSVVILQLLVRAQQMCGTQSPPVPELKLVHQIANLITRSVLEDSISMQTAQCGMEFLERAVKSNRDYPQMSMLLLSNGSLLQKTTSFLPDSASPKDHSELSAVTLNFITSLIECTHPSSVTGTHTEVELSLPALTSSLLSSLITVQVAGLHFWAVVFSRGGVSGCFRLPWGRGCDNIPKHTRRLTFIVQNLLTKDNKAVREAAAACFTRLLSYTTSHNVAGFGDLQPGIHGWGDVFLRYVCDMHHNSTLPRCYLPCLAKLFALTSVEGPQIRDLRPLGQLVYKSFVIDESQKEKTKGMPPEEQQDFRACFREIQRLDKEALDMTQWNRIAL